MLPRKRVIVTKIALALVGTSLIITTLVSWIYHPLPAQYVLNVIVGGLERIPTLDIYLASKRRDYLTPEEARIDVASELRARNATELAKIRRRAIAFVWKGDPPFDRMPGSAIEEVGNARSPGLIEPTRMWKITVKMEHGVVSYPVLMESGVANNNCLFLYNTGHMLPKFGMIKFFNTLLEHGCDVIVVNLPLQGDNNHPVVMIGGRLVQLTEHNQFEGLQTEIFSPIKYFLEPPIVALNFAVNRKSYDRIAISGISGGGWVATVVSALDARIDYTYPVAGSLPLYLRQIGPRDRGDWEQREPSFYRVINYFELYLLNVLSPRRSSHNIYVKYDNCCFNGIRTAGFSAQLEGIARRWGLGSIRFIIDDSIKSHNISEWAKRHIVRNFLERK